MQNTRRSLLTSAICLLLCFSMLLGTTFAWFTDMAASNDNVVKSGELNAEMYWSESYLSADADGWNRANGEPIFTYDNWEPGYTDIKYIKVENAGDLAFKWRLTIEAAGELTELADVIDVYYVNPVDATLTALDGKVSSGSLRAVVNSRIAATGVLLPEGEGEYDTVLAIALHMDKEAGNKYQDMSIGDGFSINLVATQYDYESDAFGSGYDTDAEWPTPAISGTVTMTAPVTRADDDTVAEDVTLTSENGKLRAIIPAGAKLAPGVTELTAVAKDVAAPKANIVVSSTEVATSLDFHVYGLAADNDVPVRFEADELLPRGLNVGNYDLYHVENGTTNKMTLLGAGATSVHNGYEYDPATGNSALHLATFSEIALVADMVNPWNGTIAGAFAGGTGTEADPYLIANADQLAYLNECISNDNENYGAKSYKLLSDINLGGEDNANAGIIFYPIGYHAIGGTVALADLDNDAPEFLYFDEDPDYAQGTASVASEDGETTVNWYTYGGSLQGTFDGDGHTIANVYQNTWQLKGNYDGNYWNAAMGIFGYVNGGTVKNLTVDNFSSDGEFTPTGVIAAYARDAAFENIAITNCNPRVYNTGNGGIVGIGGHSTADTDSDRISFTNITIDNTNKITALWGSWDVACGGLIGMFRGAGHVDMTNCHVAAQIDVYNDVCGNYQYYWYRYSGMMIGTNKNMITDDKGYTVPETDKFHAENCTVHFGDWNNYYYCELVANSIASYTHDHQFSRLTEVDAVDVENMTYTVDGEDRAIPTSGRVNYVVVNGSHATENATCYHFVNGAVWNHEDAGTEVVGGETILKEDRQHYYLPFNQLFTGYGWGVKHIPVYNGEGYAFDGITILDRTEAGSVEKFKFVYDNSVISADKKVTITELISYLQNCGVDVNSASFHISITNLDENGKVTVSVNRDNSDWKNTTVTFKNTGKIRLTVQDYYYCTPTSIELTVVDRDAVANKLTGDFLYRVGNKNAVEFGLLFTTKNNDKVEAINPDSVSVEIAAITDGVNYTITNTNGTDWRNGTVQFSGTGVVKVSVTDNDYCISTELTLEVVDGTNTTGATSATSGNVVLLGNISSGFTVSGRYTFYGNGFTLNYTGNGQYLNNGLKQGVINITENGTVDNLRIIAPIYPYAYMYYGSTLLGDYVQGGPSSVEGTKTRYHYQLSAISAKDNSTISNCYVYGGRNNIFVDTGDITIKDTILECGTVANVQIQSNATHTITLEDVTTIQYCVPGNGQDNNGNNISNTMLGAGILVGPETTNNPKLILKGEFKQYNWVTASDKESVTPEAAKMIIEAALNATAYNHTINGEVASNLGIIFMNEYEADVQNNTGLPYEKNTITMKVSGQEVKGQACSLVGATAKQIYSDYSNADKSTVNGLYAPQFKYDSTLGDQFIENTEGCDEYLYREGDTIKVMFVSGDTKTVDLAALVNIAKYTGQNLNLVITCKDADGNDIAVTDGKISLSEIKEYIVTYTVTDTVFYDKDGKTVTDTKTYSWNVTLSVSLKDKSIPDAYFDYDTTKQTMGYAKKSLIASGQTQYLPFLAGLKIYDYIGQEAYLRFDGDNDFNKIASATITGYTSANHVLIEVKLVDGGVISVDTTARAVSGGSTYTGTLNTSGNTLYYVNGGTTSATTTTWVISNYSFVGNNGVTIDSGSVTFANCENGSVPTGSFGTTINYTVSYESNGGTCGQTTGYATSVSSSVTLPTPTRSGYIFAGWYTAASGGTKVGGAGATYTPSANITLYAQWVEPFDVTYDANGGACDITSEKYTGTALVLPTPTNGDKNFDGWFTAASGGTRVGGAGDIYRPDEAITLYAQWSYNVTVSYNANGGSVSTTSASVELGASVTLPTPASRTGYTFNGWYTAASGGTMIGAAGASYTPTANVTLYAQWTVISYTITVTTSNATVKVNGTEVSNNGTVSIQYGAQVTVEVTYSKNNSQSTTITGTDGTTYNSPFNMPAQDVDINATSSGCFAEGTLITLADGTQKPIEEITYDDVLLAWDFNTGAYVATVPSLIEAHETGNYRVINLNFADGTVVRVIVDHGFFDVAENNFVYINESNVASYVGHSFIKTTADGSYESVEFVGYEITVESVSYYTIQTAIYNNCIAEGMLTLTSAPDMLDTDDWFDYFEIGEGMKYDEEKMQADIEKYGLYTYDDFAEYVTYEQFIAFNGPYLKVLVGRGVVTFDEIIALISIYVNP